MPSYIDFEKLSFLERGLLAIQYNRQTKQFALNLLRLGVSPDIIRKACDLSDGDFSDVQKALERGDYSWFWVWDK